MSTSNPHERDALFYEYSEAADPISAGLIAEVPCVAFPASIHEARGTRVIALDLSDKLGCVGPATSPGLCASFVRIEPRDSIALEPNASSQLYFALRGQGVARFDGEPISWRQGDVLTFPGPGAVQLEASEDATLYWVHDEPLLRYLGASATRRTFEPTHYRADVSRAELEKALKSSAAATRNRISVLLANRACAQTRTVTPALWAMLGIVPAGQSQPAHRHQSVALDLVIDCKPGCYTLVGKDRNSGGKSLDPARVDWQPGSVFVTPPGYWHSHHNESDAPAYIMPIQDAGLQTYLRSLDIRFASAK